MNEQLNHADGVVAFVVVGHRDRDPARQAAPDLRGVPAGRRDDEPPLRRHRPRTVDQPRDRRAARRRDPRRVDAPGRARPSRSTCPRPTRRRSSAAPAPPAPPALRRTATSRPSPSRSSTARSCCRARSTDDRDELGDGDRVVLVVEDDAEFARTVQEVARERGFKTLVALRGDTGLALAHEYKPDAIVLDLKLPVIDGADAARPAEAPPGDAAHPRAHRLGRRRPPAGAAGGRGRVPREARRARRARGRVRLDRELHRPRRSQPARGRGRRGPAQGDRRARRRRRRRERRRGRVERRGARRARGHALRLHGPRPEAARQGRLLAPRAGQEERGAPRRARDRLHRQGPHAPGGDAAEEVRGDDHRQGRPLTRAAARRDRALPPPRRVAPARPSAAACSSSCTPPTRSSRDGRS